MSIASATDISLDSILAICSVSLDLPQSEPSVVILALQQWAARIEQQLHGSLTLLQSANASVAPNTQRISRILKYVANHIDCYLVYRFILLYQIQHIRNLVLDRQLIKHIEDSFFKHQDERFRTHLYTKLEHLLFTERFFIGSLPNDCSVRFLILNLIIKHFV